MDSNYLEEIKIIKRPRPKNTDKKSAQSSGLKDKTSLIETLRTKEKKVEEEQAKISAADIQKLKTQLALRNSSARPLPVKSEISSMHSRPSQPAQSVEESQKPLPVQMAQTETPVNYVQSVQSSLTKESAQSSQLGTEADIVHSESISQNEKSTGKQKDIFDTLSDKIDSWAIDIIGMPEDDDVLSDNECLSNDNGSSDINGNPVQTSFGAFSEASEKSKVSSENISEVNACISQSAQSSQSAISSQSAAESVSAESSKESLKVKAALAKDAGLIAREAKRKAKLDAHDAKIAEKQKLLQARAEEKKRIRAAKLEKNNEIAARKTGLAAIGNAKRAERKAKHTASEKLLQAKNKLANAKPKKLGNHIILRYLIKELSVYFIVSFAFFFVVFFVNEILVLAETILRQHVPVLSVIRLILYKLPAIVAQSAPFATLVGFLMCLGRIVTDNEMLVLRASGFKYSFIAVPVVIIGLVISVFSFVMNDYFLPLGSLKFNRLKRQIVQKDPAVEIEENSVKRINGTTLIIGNVNDENIIDDLVIFDTDQNGRDRVIVTGKSNLNKSTEDGILMQFNMAGSTVFQLDRQNYSKFDVVESQKVLLNVFDTFVQDLTDIAPSEMTSFDLHKTIQDLKKDKTITKLKLNRYNLEFYKKFSLPFGSIFFAILAFPLALVFGRKDGQTLGLIFGIIISVMYWAATILGQMFGVRSGYNGFWMMWSPNIFIGILGIILYLRLRKK